MMHYSSTSNIKIVTHFLTNFSSPAGRPAAPDADHRGVRAGRVPPTHRVHPHGLCHAAAADAAGRHERGRLLRAGGVAPCLRWLCPVLHQRGHRVRPVGFGRAVHPVQVHQESGAEGAGVCRRARQWGAELGQFHAAAAARGKVDLGPWGSARGWVHQVPGGTHVEQEVLWLQLGSAQGGDWELSGVYTVPQDSRQCADAGGSSAGDRSVLNHYECVGLSGGWWLGGGLFWGPSVLSCYLLLQADPTSVDPGKLSPNSSRVRRARQSHGRSMSVQSSLDPYGSNTTLSSSGSSDPASGPPHSN